MEEIPDVPAEDILEDLGADGLIADLDFDKVDETLEAKLLEPISDAPEDESLSRSELWSQKTFVLCKMINRKYLRPADLFICAEAWPSEEDKSGDQKLVRRRFFEWGFLLHPDKCSF